MVTIIQILCYSIYMTYITIKVDQAKAEEIKDFYHATEIKDKQYEYFLTKKNQVTIHAFMNRKEIYSIVFSGENEAEVKEEASFFSKNYTIKNVSTITKEKDAYYQGWEDLNSQIGSDEVGVGDFFGPLIVTASYVSKEDIDYLEKLKVNDSKKMNDEYIMEIGPKLKAKIKNFVIMVSSDKISKLEETGMKMHKIMAKIHNLTHKDLIEKYGLSDNTIIYIDQFEREELYRKYVDEEIVSNPLYFRTKGESYYPSVAASSVIARYVFLSQWKKMEQELGMVIPKGAGSEVDKVYGILKKKYPQEILDKYVKRHFRNYKI